MRWLSFAIYGKFFFCSLLLLTTIISCNNRDSDKASAYQPVFSSDSSGKKILLLGLPSFSYSETAAPLVRYLNVHLPGLHIKMKACVSFDEYLEYLNDQKFDLTLINGIQALDAINKGYSIFGKVTDDDKYAGVIFTQKNAGIEKPADLKGKKLALVPSRTIPGTMMSMYYLHQNGLNVNHDITQVKVSSFESAIIAVYIGKSDAGVCLKRSWDVYIRNHPEILTKVSVKWESPPLINNALLAKRTMDSTVRSQLVGLFFSMQNSPEGKEVLRSLDFSGFQKADNDTYQPMMDFKRKYDAAIQ
jgi:phosphonate transport system substrate-binding protein